MAFKSTVRLFKVTCTMAAHEDFGGTYFSQYPFKTDEMHFSGHDDGGKNYVLPYGWYSFTDSIGGQNAFRQEYDWPNYTVSKRGNPILNAKEKDTSHVFSEELHEVQSYD